MLADVRHISRSNSPGRAKVSRSIKTTCYKTQSASATRRRCSLTVCLVYGVNYTRRFKTDASRCCTYFPSMHIRQILTNYTRSRGPLTCIIVSLLSPFLTTRIPNSASSKSTTVADNFPLSHARRGRLTRVSQRRVKPVKLRYTSGKKRSARAPDVGLFSRGSVASPRGAYLPSETQPGWTVRSTTGSTG